MLKLHLDTLDGVDESGRALYTEKDGKFVLGIEGLPQQEDVTGLKAKVDELLGEKTAAEKARKEAEETAHAEREEAARKSGNVEELEKSWSEKYTHREAELTGRGPGRQPPLAGSLRPAAARLPRLARLSVSQSRRKASHAPPEHRLN